MLVLDIPVTQCDLHVVAAETLLGKGDEQALMPLAYVLREGDGSPIWSRDHIDIFKEALQEGNRNPVFVGQKLSKARAVHVDRQYPVDRKTRDAITNHLGAETFPWRGHPVLACVGEIDEKQMEFCSAMLECVE